MKSSSFIKVYIVRPMIWLNYKLFGFFNKNKSKLNILYAFFQTAFNQWMCFRFKCYDCSFKYPLNFRLNEQYFEIGERTRFGKFAVLTAWDFYEGDHFSPEVSIGKNCNFGDYLHLTCINKISIGDGVLTGRWVTITDNSHGKTNFEELQIQPSKRKLYTKGPVVIGDNVWIGDKVTILPGVIIGDGAISAIIGANCVVTQNIPPYSVVGGNPAKVIKVFK